LAYRSAAKTDALQNVTYSKVLLFPISSRKSRYFLIPDEKASRPEFQRNRKYVDKSTQTILRLDAL